MSYELSFSQDFFGYGETKHSIEDNPKALNLYTAIRDLVLKRIPDPAINLLNMVGIHVVRRDVTEALYNKAVIVNTCSNLNTPVEVWLDEEGYVTVEVY